MSSWVGRSGVDIVPRNRIRIETDKRLVTVKMSGGLGNRLFQIMAGLGYAERSGREFVFYEDTMKNNAHTDYAKTTEMLLAFFPKVKVWRGALRWRDYTDVEGGVYAYNAIPDLSGSVRLSGYFQRFEYFPSGAREQFVVPKPKVVRFDSSGVDFSHAYFVHFRLGDYVDTKFDVGLSEYYTAAIREIRDVDPDAFFLVFSDQVKKLQLDGYGLGERCTVMPEGVGTWESLWLMSRCHGAVCANSTFSWFGAFAVRGDGPIYMPARWNRESEGNPVPPWVKTV